MADDKINDEVQLFHEIEQHAAVYAAQCFAGTTVPASGERYARMGALKALARQAEIISNCDDDLQMYFGSELDLLKVNVTTRVGKFAVVK